MSIFEHFDQGLAYEEFLNRYGNDAHRERWQRVRAEVRLSDSQRELLRSFSRDTKVLCLAGAWCGDCAQQCPIFARFAEEAPPLELRFLDRDAHADVQQELQINGGNRVPVVVFFSEDGFEVARYGERTLAKYRQLMLDQVSAGCPTGLVRSSDPLLDQVTQDWLNEFERVQWILRLSPRLRKRHGD